MVKEKNPTSKAKSTKVAVPNKIAVSKEVPRKKLSSLSSLTSNRRTRKDQSILEENAEESSVNSSSFVEIPISSPPIGISFSDLTTDEIPSSDLPIVAKKDGRFNSLLNNILNWRV